MFLKLRKWRLLQGLIAVIFFSWLSLFWYLRAPVIGSASLTIDKSLVDEQTLERHVRFLSELNPPRSFDFPESTFAAEKYIATAFSEMGYNATLQDVFVPEHTYHNVVARYGEGAPDSPVIVIGAHYDVCQHHPGADDNASGVAGLLEVARLFQTLKPKTRYPIEFVAYALEEPPYFGSDEMGSAIHAADLKNRGIDVRLMVSVEMIGYFSEEWFSQKFPLPLLYAIYPWRGNFIAAVGSPYERDVLRKFKSSFSAVSETPIYSINAPAVVPGIDFSDHRSYWRYGWPAIMVTDTSFYRNMQYHLEGDVAERLNFGKMKDVVEGLYSSTLAFAQ